MNDSPNFNTNLSSTINNINMNSIRTRMNQQADLNNITDIQRQRYGSTARPRIRGALIQ